MTSPKPAAPQKYAISPLNGASPGPFKDALETNLRLIETSILQIIDRIGGLSVGGGAGGSSSTIIVTGSDSSFWRLNDLVTLAATTTAEQNAFTVQGSGSRSIPPLWWAAGKRLIFAIPMQYALTPPTAFAIRVKCGSDVMHFMERIQPFDNDILLLVLDIKSVAGSVVTMKKFASWGSNFNPDFPNFSEVVFDTGGVASEMQISIQFSVADMTSTVSLQNLDFQGIKAPSAL